MVVKDKLLHERIHERLLKRSKDMFEEIEDIPSYIEDNLHHEPRPYQRMALHHFHETQATSMSDISHRHLLFHMATGSGKTMVMASNILYLFKEKGIQRFIFFVDSQAIVSKTRENLLNPTSSKYLFRKEGIRVEGQSISIQAVNDFPPTPSKGVIYLKLTTIQGLHQELNVPRENALSYESLEHEDVVLLADEAHHYNAVSRGKKMTEAEKEKKSWEHTISQILALRPGNRLLEYTATMNLSNEGLYEKYQDKIVFNYSLSEFMRDGYSKRVVLLQTNEDDERKMLHAVLLSQYRKYIARDHDISLKPIILFKSNKIATSMEAEQHFHSLIGELTLPKLEEIVQQGLAVYGKTTSVWQEVFTYYNSMNLSEVVADIQWDFTKQTTLNANESEFFSVENAKTLNTLEDGNNPVRTIFAVAKLNEGWDVLNLYDIVRISEGAPKQGKIIDSEAQLIGRGARYYPFVVQEKKASVRRYDEKSTPLAILEALHYHTLNESLYIKNLMKSLDAADVEIHQDERIPHTAKVKKQFKKNPIYQRGKIFVNEARPTTEADYDRLESYEASRIFSLSYERTHQHDYGEMSHSASLEEYHEVEWVVNRTWLQKGTQRNPFFHFSNLRNYMPAIHSMNDFLDDERFLKGTTFYIQLPTGMTFANLSAKEKLRMVDRYMVYVSEKIRNNYMKDQGTEKFVGKDFSDYIQDYKIEVAAVRNRSYEQHIESVNMEKESWFIFDTAIVNQTEKNTIRFLKSYMKELEERFDEVHVIRNEKRVKLTEIGKSRGFMPDFLLYMRKGEEYTQAFLETKGSVFEEKDRWKEDLLLYISNPENIIVEENEHVRLVGLRFYVEGDDNIRLFRQDFKEKLLPKEEE